MKWVKEGKKRKKYLLIGDQNQLIVELSSTMIRKVVDLAYDGYIPFKIHKDSMAYLYKTAWKLYWQIVGDLNKKNLDDKIDGVELVQFLVTIIHLGERQEGLLDIDMDEYRNQFFKKKYQDRDRIEELDKIITDLENLRDTNNDRSGIMRNWYHDLDNYITQLKERKNEGK